MLQPCRKTGNRSAAMSNGQVILVASVRKRTWKTGGVVKTAWVADYFDQAGKRRLKTFDTRKAADAWLVNARHEVGARVSIPPQALASPLAKPVSCGSSKAKPTV